MVTSILLKASILLAAAACAHLLLVRRASAATRHLLWTLTTTGLLLLPVLSVVLPSWTVAHLDSTTTPSIVRFVDAPTVVPAPADADFLLLNDTDAPETSPAASAFAAARRLNLPLFYFAGVALLAARLFAQRLSLRRLAARSTEVREAEWQLLLSDCAEEMRVSRPVRLLRSLEPAMPMTLGLRENVILLPAIADTWSDDRRRAVLLHELAHISRRDCLAQSLAAAACALYWIHPGVWWVARRLRTERELACDDRVLAAGADARDYADHLLDIAYAFGGHAAPAVAVGMASSRQLEGRLLAVLDSARNRATPLLRSRLAGLALLIALLVPIAAASARVASRNEIAQPVALTLATQPADAGQLAAPQPPMNAGPGTWEIRPTEQAGSVRLRLTDENGSHGTTIKLQRFEGLSQAQLAAGGPVQFKSRRDAGTFEFEGVLRGGVGAGTYVFVPNAGFADALTKRGFDRVSEHDQQFLARQDVGFSFLDELAAQGYTRPNLAQLIQAAQHGVSFSYLREMGRLGYRLAGLGALVEQRDHGVTPDYVRGMADAGLPRLSAADLVKARSHGIDPDYIHGLADLGYRDLDLEHLITLRSHGIDAEYVQGLRQLGYANLSTDALIAARSHGIDPGYVQSMRALGYSLSLDELKTARSHGIVPEFIQEFSSYGHLSMADLVRVRSHGIDIEYVNELQSLGYTGLSIDDLAGLRSHGITPDDVRRANAQSGTRLPIDRLESLASRGWR